MSNSDAPATRLAAGVTFAAVALGLLTALPADARAQAPAKVPRVGLLSVGSSISPSAPLRAFRQGLRDLGYVEGRTIVIESRAADRRPERLPALAAELVRLNVDVIVTTGDGEVRAARAATSTIPIVMAVSGDPVGSGYVASLARPGGNVTGLSFLSPDLSAKLLELLKETAPRVARVAVLWNAANPVKVLDFQATERAARTLGLRLESVEVRTTQDFDAVFAAIGRGRPDALLVLVDEFVNQYPKLIGEFVTRARVLAIAGDPRHVEAGCLMSYGPDLSEMFRRAAAFVDKILKGEKSGDLPVEQPAKFELVVNVGAARALGLTVPASVLLRADRIIQ